MGRPRWTRVTPMRGPRARMIPVRGTRRTRVPARGLVTRRLPAATDLGQIILGDPAAGTGPALIDQTPVGATIVDIHDLVTLQHVDDAELRTRTRTHVDGSGRGGLPGKRTCGHRHHH